METMTHSHDTNKEPLKWPVLIDHIDDQYNVLEHIELKTNVESFDELLFEVEMVHPHVARKLHLLIGYPEFEIEMNNLMFDTRQNRQGFSKFILNLLFKIYNLHIKKYGKLTSIKTDLWETNHSF